MSTFYLNSPRRAIFRQLPEANLAARSLAEHHRSFHNYADYALSNAFGDALRQVLDLGANRRVALMCAEAVWWRCHRRIITDYLVLNGHPVDHLMGSGQIEHATPTPGAVRTNDGKVTYPTEPAEAQIGSSAYP